MVLRVGQGTKARVTVTLKKELEYSRDDVRFVSENPEIALITCVNSLYGEYYFYTIKALSEGETYVYAESKDGSITSQKIRVIARDEILVEQITLSQTEADLVLGETIPITAEIFPANAENPLVSWTSDNREVATAAFEIDSGEGKQIFVTVEFSIAGEKTYVWEKDLEEPDENDPEGLMVFYIWLNPNGTFEYHVRPHSSHIGSGHWTKSGDIITLKEDGAGFDKVFYFLDQGDRLVVIAEGSDDFGGAEVEDGDSFLYREDFAPYL